MALIVNSERIEDSDILQEAERLRPEYEKTFADMNTTERETQLFDWSRENLIERILLKQEARNNCSATPKDQIETVFARWRERYENPEEFYVDLNAKNDQQIKESIDLELRLERKFESLHKNLPKSSKAEIERYYNDNKDQFKTSEELRVAHIVKYVNWQADDKTAYQQIKSAQDELNNSGVFELVASKYSDCKDNGGDLGYITRGEMVEEFEDVVFNLDTGQISDIFRTRFGFHIAKVYDRKSPALLSLEDVKQQITDELADRKRDQIISEFIDQLRSKATIENA